LLGDLDRAEEALHQAFIAALEQWPADGIPKNPCSWLISAGRFKGIDALRRQARFDASLEELRRRIEVENSAQAEYEDASIEDDRLRLIFICAHPALKAEARLALTLREVCGLTTEEIARAFLAKPQAIAKRIVRAKAVIRDERIPYEVPLREELPERLASVLHVIYMLFTEGYKASFGNELTRPDISAEAIQLARLLLDLCPQAEVTGLLALLLLHESRRAARVSAEGDLTLLEDQDRTLWNHAQIDEGLRLLRQAMARGEKAGQYTLQAAIAATHADAASPAETDWAQIMHLYDALLTINPSPVVALNRAVALAMRDGPVAGLTAIDAILARGDLRDYHPAHAARADLLRRLGRSEEAIAAYERALQLTSLIPTRRFLQRRLSELRSINGQKKRR
jgi:RNA polymerase sigma-70 factor, ECF subfamily